MCNIAIISFSGFNHKAGAFYAIHNRAKFLSQMENLKIDFYNFCPKPSFLLKLLRRKKKQVPIQHIYDGLKYNTIFYPSTLIDYITNIKLKLKAFILDNSLSKKVEAFKNYDLIIAHSVEGSIAAYKASQKYKIPYINIWHGSDINIGPIESKYKFRLIKKIITNAENNIFVSNKLFKTARDLFGAQLKGCVIYNGASDSFKRKSHEERIELRQKYNCSDKHIIAFVGNIINIKNPLSLPDIFAKINAQIENCEFWIIGKGVLKNRLEKELLDRNLTFRFWGHVSTEQIVEMYNCTEVLVLPSFNEGLPLVTVEALKCGCSCVGSDRGGIPEAIGSNNTFALNDNFADNVANRAFELINTKSPTQLKACFDWKYCAKQEAELINKILGCSN